MTLMRSMKFGALIITLVLGLVVAACGGGASYQTAEGTQAYKSGDYEAAGAILSPLAVQGVPEAQGILGKMLFYGRGVEQDYEGAAYWWELAAVQGLADAQSDLGTLYHQGLGVERDYEKAAFWYHLAARQGHQWAQINIGGLYFNGDGVTQDYAMAAYWFANGQLGDNSDATAEATKWIETSELVAQRLQSSPFDALKLSSDDREKLSGDDITAALIGVLIAGITAGLLSDPSDFDSAAYDQYRKPPGCSSNDLVDSTFSTQIDCILFR